MSIKEYQTLKEAIRLLQQQIDEIKAMLSEMDTPAEDRPRRKKKESDNAHRQPN